MWLLTLFLQFPMQTLVAEMLLQASLQLLKEIQKNVLNT